MKILGLNITRARGQEVKESATWPAVMSLYAGRPAVYTPKNYADLSKAGYQLCATSYACVSLIARSAAGIRWTASKRQSDGSMVEYDTHPLLDLLAHPNEYDSGYRFVEAILSHKLLAGNSYIEKVHGIKSAPPKFLYALRPDRMTIKPGDAKGLVANYIYKVNGREIVLDLANILHLKDFHPLDDFYGLSKVEVAATSIDISNASQEWNLKHLQNDMHISGLLTLKGMTPEQSRLIQEQFREKYQGYKNAGKVAVLENIEDSDFKPLAMTPRDADWTESEKRNLRRICAVFNIWSGLLGDNENTTYSNMQEGRKALYQEAVLPEMDALCDGFNHFLAPLYEDGLVIGYDRDAIEALQEERGSKYAYLAQANWLKVNEKRVACGYDEVPEGDVILTGMGEMSLADATAPAGDLSATDNPTPPPAPAQSDNDEDEDADADEDNDTPPAKGRKSLGGFWRGENEQKALWMNFERRVTTKERAFQRELKAFFENVGKSVVARANDGVTDPPAMLDSDRMVKTYISKFTPRYRKLYATALSAGRSMTEGKLYEFDGDEKAEGWIDDETRKKLEKLIAETANVIKDETLAEIQSVMKESLDTNLTIEEIAEALRIKLVDQMPMVRSYRVARTETAMIENAGNIDGFRESEFVTRKGWLCSFVEHSREEHKDASGQEVGIDDQFRVGGDLMDYPLDRSHSPAAGNVINCLCTCYPIVD